MYQRILVALDGSAPSCHAGRMAAEISRASGAGVVACHVFSADIHRSRFSDMEPGLPEKYQQAKHLAELRSTHNTLMDEGLKAVSAGYLENFVDECRDSGLKIESVAAEGRSYEGILHLAEKYRCDLIALGADGIGAVGNGMLGGTTTRVLQNAPGDLLIARCAPGDGPILTGIDGGEESLKTAEKAVKLATILKRTVHLTAAYDPDFHTGVFHTMEKTLSPENQDKVGLMGQKKLHDEIINKGLGSLYEEFLCEARGCFNGSGTPVETFLVTGKPYCALETQARRSGAGLIVIGRHGHHRRPHSRLGSNAEGLLRTTSANVLLIGGANTEPLPRGEQSHDNGEELSAKSGAGPQWDREAQERLMRVPGFIRNIARRVVERAVRQSGKDRVTVNDFADIAAKFGMGAQEKD